MKIYILDEKKKINWHILGWKMDTKKNNFSIVVERLRMLAASVDDAWKDGISDRMEDD